MPHFSFNGIRLEASAHSLKVLVGTLLWLAVVLAGTLGMMGYSETPGEEAVAPQQWPLASHVARVPGSATLVMFVHPQCPCSRASIGELEQLVADCQGHFRTYVWFLQPEGRDEAWTQTDLWRSAKAIPGVTVGDDIGGHEAQLFQAKTSGQTLFYDKDGSLIFQGGITSARGHSGDNAGRSALVSLAKESSRRAASTPVFGCELFGNVCLRKEIPCTP